MKNKDIKDNSVTENTGKSKKKSALRLIIIIAAVLVLAAAAVVGGSFLVPKSVEGAWELTVNPEVLASTADEAEEADKVYYVFEKPDKYGKGNWKTCYASGVEHYKYELSEEGSVEKINLGSVDLEYSITGSKLLGNAKITLIYPEYTDESTGVKYEAEEYVLEQAKDPDYEHSSYNDFKVDEKLLGEWANNERTLSYYYYSLTYTETVSIEDNGVMTIRYESSDLGLDRYMYYAYTADGSKLTFSPVTDKDTRYTIAYEFDDDNLEFLDDNTSASIFADAFFGGFTFYRPENLPEPSLASEDEMYLLE